MRSMSERTDPILGKDLDAGNSTPGAWIAPHTRSLPLRVLCVDDERSNRRFISRSVRRMGVQVVLEASDGIGALRQLHVPDLLVRAAEGGHEMPSRQDVLRASTVGAGTGPGQEIRRSSTWMGSSWSK